MVVVMPVVVICVPRKALGILCRGMVVVIMVVMIVALAFVWLSAGTLV